MTATMAASAAVIKTLYPGGELPNENFKVNTALALLDKDTKFVGDPYVIAIQSETAQGASADFGYALGSLAQGVYNKFQVSKYEYFGIARIKGQALKAVVKDTGALTNLWENEMKGISFTVTRQLAIHFFRNGTGSLGRLDGVNTVTATTVTLQSGVTGQPPSDINNFCVGMRVYATASDGGTLLAGGQTATITGVDRANGTLTIAANWDATIAGITNTCFLYRAGDLNMVPNGVEAWIPGGATPGTFKGLNRNSDPVRYAGQFLDCSQMPMHEALIEAQARAGEHSGMPDYVFAHPRDIATMKKQLDAKVNYPRTDVKSKVAGITFRGLELEGDNGVLTILGDVNHKRGKFSMLQLDRWRLHSLGPAPQILDFDDNTFLRVANDDAYEVRTGLYGEYECNGPAYQIRGINWGT